LSEEQLAEHGAQRHTAITKPGFPDRVELRDADIGEQLLLVNYTHQPASTPYRASHAIFVREGAERAYDEIGLVPEPFRLRPMSLRAFDGDHMMRDADLAVGSEFENVLERLFSNPEVSYIHAHYAKRGCYAALVERA
jgi:hypothetical protein